MNKKKIAVACAVAAVAAAGYLTYENYAIGTTYYTVEADGASEEFGGFRICHLSDIHVKKHGRTYSQLIRLTEKQHPDIIAITGDLVDSRDSDIPSAISLIETLCDIAPVYYVTGNHEERLPAQTYLELMSALNAAGAHILDGKAEKTEINGLAVNIAGFSDNPEFDIKEASTLLDSGAFNILLNHRPQFAPDYAEAGADLSLCGHAHGGQIRLPFIGGIIAPDQYFFPTYSEGLLNFGKGCTVISRGIGNSLLPFRVNNRPELVVIDIT